MEIGIVLICVVISLSSAAGAYFLLSWQLRARVRECEFAVDLMHGELMRRNKVAAGDASAASRRARAINPDEALIARALVEQNAATQGVDGPAPWWGSLMKGKSHGSESR